VITAPAAIVDVELSSDLPDIGALAQSRWVRVLVRLHGHPLGMLDLSGDELKETDHRAMITGRFEVEIERHYASSHPTSRDAAVCSWAAAVRGPVPDATIVINSCAASDGLRRTIDSALAQDYPDAMVMVVDNRPAKSGIEAALRSWFPGETRLSSVSESKPGLGRARNAGLHASATEIVAFTDDDVVLDPSWLGRLVAGFYAADGVACVTGFIAPLELETPAQVFMEEFSGFAKGFELQIWDSGEHRLAHPLYPYTVGLFGSGASAAFRRQVLLDAGGFDPYLGIGTPAIGGEDIDIYTRLVLGGHRIVYQPASLLWHLHRRDMRAANRQIQGYGAGLTAMLTKHLVTGRATRRAVLSRIPAGLRYALSPDSPKNARKPPEFTMRQSLLEWAGMAYGPIGYFRSRLAG